MNIIDELMRNKPSGGPDPPEAPVCREFERCQGCPGSKQALMAQIPTLR